MGFVCTKTEVAFLSSLLGADTMMGLPDPFTGWLAEEVEQAWSGVRQSLLDRGVLTDRPLTVVPEVRKLVSIAAMPAGTIVATYTPGAGGVSDARYFHAAIGTVVEMSTQGDRCEFHPWAGPDAALARICEHIRLDPGRLAPWVPAGSLPSSELARARAQAAAGDADGASRTLTAHLPADTALALAESLSRPLGSAGVTSIFPGEGEWAIGALGLLNSESGLWLLKETPGGGGQRVTVFPIDTAGAMAEVRHLTARALLLEAAPV